MHMAQSMGMLTEDSIESMSNQKDNIISHGERHTAASIIWSFECNSLNLQIWSFSFPLVNAHVLSLSVSCKNMRYKQHRTRGCAISGAKICSSKCSYPKKSWAPSLVTNSELFLACLPCIRYKTGLQTAKQRVDLCPEGDYNRIEKLVQTSIVECLIPGGLNNSYFLILLTARIQDQYVRKHNVWLGPSPLPSWLIYSCSLSVSSHGLLVISE